MVERNKKPLANPKSMRSISDRLDEAAGWKGGYKDESNVRALIHGVWHVGAGIVTANTREFTRAGEQFEKMGAFCSQCGKKNCTNKDCKEWDYLIYEKEF